MKDCNGKKIKYMDVFMVTERLGDMGEVDLTYTLIYQDDRFVVRGVNNNNQFEEKDFNFSECEIINA